MSSLLAGECAVPSGLRGCVQGGSVPVDRRPAEAWHGGHELLGTASLKSAFTMFRAEAFTVKVVLPVQLSPSSRSPLPGLRQLSSISKLFPESVTPDVIRVASNLELWMG